MSPSGIGEETVKVFGADGEFLVSRLIDDSQLSPLDLAVAPNGNIVVSSEWPFGAKDAVSSVREYDTVSGRLVRIFAPDASVGFRNPRGLRVGPDGNLYCVPREEVVCFDFDQGVFSEAVVRVDGLFGQALEFFD